MINIDKKLLNDEYLVKQMKHHLYIRDVTETLKNIMAVTDISHLIHNMIFYISLVCK